MGEPYGSDLFKYDRLTPSRARKIAEAIRSDPEDARAFENATVEKLARLIPPAGEVRLDRVEQAFLIAVEAQKLFDAAACDIWAYFPKYPERSLLGEIFVRAVEGASLREIVESAASETGRDGEIYLNAGELFLDEAAG